MYNIFRGRPVMYRMRLLGPIKIPSGLRDAYIVENHVEGD